MSPKPDTTTAASNPPASERRSMPPLVFALICTIVVVALGAIVLAFTREDSASGLTSSIRDNRFQAVYMTNDRVYFGKVRDVEGDWFTIEDAFFLRRAASDTDAKDAAAATTEIVAVKQEVGGDGDLVVNAREVTLVQNLTANSDVSRTIEDALKD